VEGDERRSLLLAACARYEQAVAAKPDGHEAPFGWGIALGMLAEAAEGDERQGLLRAACARYEQAMAAKPDKHEALNNWVSDLVTLAHEVSGDERRELLEKAQACCEQANVLSPHVADYNLACALSMLGRFDEAWALLVSVIERDPEMRAHAVADADLAPLWAAHPAWLATFRESCPKQP